MAARDIHGVEAPWDPEGRKFDVVGQPGRKVDGHAKATADHIGGKDFADALDERSLIRRDADGRNKMVDVQKSLARPAGGVAVSQTMSGT